MTRGKQGPRPALPLVSYPRGVRGADSPPGSPQAKCPDCRTRPAQIGALAAFEDRDWLAHVQAQVAAAREEIARIARDNGLTPLPSATNFVTVDCGGDGARARALVAALATRGVFVRMPFVAPEDRCIRISCGTEADLAVLAKALPAALAEVT